MRLIVVSIMVTLLSGCGSIISRTIPGQGHGNNIIPVCNGMCVTPPGVMSRSLIRHSLVFDTLLLPIDIHHGPYE